MGDETKSKSNLLRLCDRANVQPERAGPMRARRFNDSQILALATEAGLQITDLPNSRVKIVGPTGCVAELKIPT